MKLVKTLFLAASTLAVAVLPAAAKDYLVTITKPGNLYVIDAADRSVTKECKLDFNVIPAIIAMSPDNSIAYILGDRWGGVFGVNIDSCETVFSANQSYDDVRSRVIGSLAVSKDGKEIYTIRNRTRILVDRYEVLDPELVVYDSSAGLDAKPIRTFPAPRRMTIMATDRKGKLYVGGHELYEIDPATGATSVKIANASWDRPTYSPPDVLAFWPVGTQNDEFLLLYSAAKFANDKREEIADFVWGYESVNLTTGESQIADFASFEVIMFSAVRNPKAPNELYGVYTQLSKHDLEKNELVKRVDLPHTYYCVNISSDGKEIYVGGTNDDIGVYDASTLERIGEVRLPSGGDMAAGTMHVISRGG
ncbi:MAG: quinohemoprotein amine dehydrogenase subunit beta [Hyphomicrobiales bacterium]|nr:MAG: quinohemoprotein amine dehydrogenase subunit beta [Hyphomicrobiales bacterium]